MRRGGRGGNGAGAGALAGDRLREARQVLLSLFDGAQHGDRGRAGGGSGLNGPTARGAGKGGRPREGEWACRCGFETNRSWRDACFRCGRPRAIGEMQQARDGKGARSKGSESFGGKGDRPYGEARRGGGGPAGAGGARPPLGYRGADAWGGPGKSAKGTAGYLKGGANEGTGQGKGKGPGATQAGGTSAGASGAAMPGAQRRNDEDAAEKHTPPGVRTTPTRVIDDDGYELVQRRRTWAQAVVEGPAGGGQQSGGPTRGPAAAPRWADDDSDGEGYAEDDLCADDDGDHDDGGDHATDPRQLRDKYEALARAVREFERKSRGNQADPALLTLRAARDGAEREWREAKSPAPLATRMGRAEAKLEKAGNALERARLAVDEFDAWADARREELVHRAQEAEGWYRWRERQLRDLHEEAGEKVQGRRGGTSATSGCSAAVSGRIMHELLPEIREIIEFAQGNPEIIERLSNLAAGLEGAGQELGDDPRAAAERFDIGDDDDGVPGDWGTDDGDVDMQRTTGRGEREPRDDETTGWRPEGAGRWSRARPTEEPGTGRGAPPAPTPAAATRGKRGAEDSTGATGAAAAAGPATTQAAPPTPAGDGEDGADDRAPKHRRSTSEAEAREEADRRRALDLLQQQQQAIAAQQASYDAGAGGFGSDTALSVAAQRFVGEVHKATEQARKKGIEPKAGGKDLVELTPMELRKWVQENLGADAD